MKKKLVSVLSGFKLTSTCRQVSQAAQTQTGTLTTAAAAAAADKEATTAESLPSTPGGRVRPSSSGQQDPDVPLKFCFTTTIPWHTDRRGVCVCCHVSLCCNRAGFKDRSCWSKLLYSIRASAHTELFTWRAKRRMDAAYKKVNGNHGPVAETEEPVTGVSLIWSFWFKTTLCLLSHNFFLTLKDQMHQLVSVVMSWCARLRLKIARKGHNNDILSVFNATAVQSRSWNIPGGASRQSRIMQSCQSELNGLQKKQLM